MCVPSYPAVFPLSNLSLPKLIIATGVLPNNMAQRVSPIPVAVFGKDSKMASSVSEKLLPDYEGMFCLSPPPLPPFAYHDHH